MEWLQPSIHGKSMPRGAGPSMDIIGDIVAVGINGHALPSVIHERGFSFRWSTKRPLSETISRYRRNNTDNPAMIPKCQPRVAWLSSIQQRQSIQRERVRHCFVACPNQHVNDSRPNSVFLRGCLRFSGCFLFVGLFRIFLCLSFFLSLHQLVAKVTMFSRRAQMQRPYLPPVAVLHQVSSER